MIKALVHFPNGLQTVVPVPSKFTGAELCDLSASYAQIEVTHRHYFSLAFDSSRGTRCWVDKCQYVLRQDIPQKYHKMTLFYVIVIYPSNFDRITDPNTLDQVHWAVWQRLLQGSLTCTNGILTSLVALHRVYLDIEKNGESNEIQNHSELLQILFTMVSDEGLMTPEECIQQVAQKVELYHTEEASELVHRFLRLAQCVPNYGLMEEMIRNKENDSFLITLKRQGLSVICLELVSERTTSVHQNKKFFWEWHDLDTVTYSSCSGKLNVIARASHHSELTCQNTTSPQLIRQSNHKRPLSNENLSIPVEDKQHGGSLSWLLQEYCQYYRPAVCPASDTLIGRFLRSHHPERVGCAHRSEHNSPPAPRTAWSHFLQPRADTPSVCSLNSFFSSDPPVNSGLVSPSPLSLRRFSRKSYSQSPPIWKRASIHSGHSSSSVSSSCDVLNPGGQWISSMSPLVTGGGRKYFLETATSAMPEGEEKAQLQEREKELRSRLHYLVEELKRLCWEEFTLTGRMSEEYSLYAPFTTTKPTRSVTLHQGTICVLSPEVVRKTFHTGEGRVSAIDSAEVEVAVLQNILSISLQRYQNTRHRSFKKEAKITEQKLQQALQNLEKLRRERASQQAAVQSRTVSMVACPEELNLAQSLLATSPRDVRSSFGNYLPSPEVTVTVNDPAGDQDVITSPVVVRWAPRPQTMSLAVDTANSQQFPGKRPSSACVQLPPQSTSNQSGSSSLFPRSNPISDSAYHSMPQFPSTSSSSLQVSSIISGSHEKTNEVEETVFSEIVRLSSLRTQFAVKKETSV